MKKKLIVVAWLMGLATIAWSCSKRESGTHSGSPGRSRPAANVPGLDGPIHSDDDARRTPDAPLDHSWIMLTGLERRGPLSGYRLRRLLCVHADRASAIRISTLATSSI